MGRKDSSFTTPDNMCSEKTLKPKTVETEGNRGERIREGLEHSIGALL
jgi:hypothetical protein